MLNPLAAYAFVAAATAAQGVTNTPDLAAGTRVRVSVRPDGPGGARTLRGTITGLEAGALTMRPDGEATAVVVRSNQVVRLERLLKPGRKTRGALIGGGVLGGAMLGLFLILCASDVGCEAADVGRVVGLVGGGAALGALLGAAASAGDRWEEVPLGLVASARPGRPRLSLSPTKGGVAARVAVTLPLRRRTP